MENNNYFWRPVSEYTGGRVLATNGLDVLIGEINSEGDCESEEDGSTVLCGITGFIKIEEMLPELKESEDERIRKALIDGFKRYNDGSLFNGCLVRDILAWLKKQKERSPLSKDEEYTLARIIEYLEDNYCPSEWKDLLHDVYALPYQKEQNPTWSEEDEKKINFLINIIRNQIRDSKYSFGYGDNVKYVTKKEIVDIIKSLKPQITWKPSDKQMNTLEYYMHTLVCNEHKEILFGLYADLKKLREE